MSEYKIIHIFDDDKFTDPAIQLFETVCPSQSYYFVLTRDVTKKLNYVASNNIIKVSLNTESELNIFVSKLNTYKVVFIHALDYKKQKIALKLPDSIIKVWFIWGYDLYDNWFLFKNKLYEKETKKVVKYQVNLKSKLIFNCFSFFIFKNQNVFKFVLPKIIIKVLNNHYDTVFYKSAKKMDIIVPVVPTEFDLIKKMNIPGVFAPFTYGSIEGLLRDKINQKVNGDNILVGNSANPTNNHIDVFIKLSKINLGDRKVYVPLSYSGSDEYISLVIKKGRQLLGDNFVPIIDFMPLGKYNEILLSCGTLIFNHVRQQGVGNIITLGYLGANMFLNHKSPVYKYYKKVGITVKPLKELNEFSLNLKLSNTDYQKNKALFLSLYSEKEVQNKIKELLSIVNNVKRCK